ncbi:prenyltransferase/squalene oxidase repeat-containing protein [Paenibacillus radicis (ex Gao et al. 2016)]|uniref:Squalene--hopene cyclase n=1 Tax=Paenibacillus radicis (ex Gao et al. 2016) TaxID=1737354 RepID=A0A917GR93_9BACL|nr:prenyltransferase/squalene oxidase repeat-containing protein [Paenibacillus radicis (ex Gao et al. 2016)]GGG54502.1 squalene--hopene cyclase [Paenibacillus radicis (ex Gao et al. 2016)]
MDMGDLRERIKLLTNELLHRQSADGAWRFCFDSGVMTDNYLIILMTALGIRDPGFIHALAVRIAAAQYQNGAWKLYPDEPEGNLETTAESCYALLCAGYYRPGDPRILQAKQFIRSKGGLSEARSLLTQVIFAATGQAEWPRQLRIPLTVFFSELGVGFDLFSLSGHARAHLVPTLVMSNKQFYVRNDNMPDLSDLFLDGSKTFTNDKTWISNLHELFSALPLASTLASIGSSAAMEQAEAYMLERLEPNDTLLTYETSTVLMIFSLLALGYSAEDPLIKRMLVGIRSLQCMDRAHIQIATSEVWDTALLSHALQEAGVSPQSTALQNAAYYLAVRQQTRKGDWAIRSPHTEPGGWGFSDINTLYPDVDDSVAALRALLPYRQSSSFPNGAASWQRGLNWVLAMRNDDAGWPAFERKGKWMPASLFQFEGSTDVATDPSTVDLTSRVLSFLGKDLGMTIGHRWIDDTVQWILSHQTKEGSWYGRWGICYINGTGAAVQGMSDAGMASDHPAIKKAANWLLSIQNEDGGWGESCLSDKVKKYVPLNASTPSQTAWALDALIAASDKLTPELEKGAEALLRTLEKRDWTYYYPTGAMLPGSVYTHYPSYNYIWPLLTLSAMVKKYGS